jgi:hypothetical protein
MRPEQFEFVSSLDTLAAVVLGALLATAGGLVAEHYEDQIERRRKERDAARFFGEILAAIDEILDFAFQSQKIGDPWGAVTVRMFRTAKRETEVYERNRERLFDIHDPPLRARIHRHFLLESFPLDAIVDYCDEVAALEDDIAAEREPARVEALKARLEGVKSVRDRTLSVLKLEREKTRDICADLVKRAQVKLGDTGRAAARG